MISAGHISSGFDKVGYPAHDLFKPFVFTLLIRYFFSKQDWKLEKKKNTLTYIILLNKINFSATGSTTFLERNSQTYFS